MSVTEQLLGPLLRKSSARPLITHYDHAVDSRVELSVATMANWAAKTANWLTEEVEIEPGDKVAVRLPAHWQTAGVLLGAWWCGAHIVHDTEDARIAFVAPGHLAAFKTITTSKTALAIVSLDPMGRGLSQLPQTASAESVQPAGAIDFLTEVRIAGDEFTPVTPTPGSTPALLSSTVDEVVAAAAAAADKAKISSQDRVLSTVEWTLSEGSEGLLKTILATLSAGAHLVQVSHPDKTKLRSCQQSERITVTVA